MLANLWTSASYAEYVNSVLMSVEHLEEIPCPETRTCPKYAMYDGRNLYVATGRFSGREPQILRRATTPAEELLFAELYPIDGVNVAEVLK